ncbi:DUF1223 domain-containing protein [Mucilaginibacter segetis]|uniref:DUF1223 domain-containing protein n=1 Tax=Mucilaginibacter segetis TaxID=2793071 RepID=A0A934PUN4_9SPHI|nr:DUF1223 domain-containing protein [Mucilaginibacter segetis]MBK0379862.1 DUF1223 domain-containing protein [Mucilaginibacter segetis]
MKTIKILMLAGCLVIAGLVSAAILTKKDAGDKNKVSANAADDNGFAVVELFTSEGCSSCPPADELVARVQKEYAGKPVYILAYHVDYWNRLGWKDVFSKAEYSQRQSKYAQWLNLRSVYTPQAVVNGQKEFVGSSTGTLHNAIIAGLRKSTNAALVITEVHATNKQATVKYTTEGAPGNAALLLAVVQKKAVSNVKRGENGGRTLTHVQIVREIENVTLEGKRSGTATITLPANFSAREYEIIGFVQNSASGEILAASRSAFNTTDIASN